MKKCSKCGETKELVEFSRDKRSKDGRRSKCKMCEKQYYQANREKKKKYYQENHEKILERRKQHYQENREKIIEQQKQYRKENREQILEQKRQYHQANREKFAEWRKQYQQANPEKCRAYNQKRRALRRKAAGNATAAEIQARFDYYGNRCYYCGCDGPMQIEHRIPLSRGGTHYPANIVPACQSCNCSKSTKTESEFVVSRCPVTT